MTFGLTFSILTPTQIMQITSGFICTISSQSVLSLVWTLSSNTFLPPASLLISVNQLVAPGVKIGFAHHSQYRVAGFFNYLDKDW
jgi:hypothetical protein